MAVVLATGATGLSGSNVCRQLIERGDTARTLARSAEGARPLFEMGVDCVFGDITEAKAVRTATCGADVVIRTAALLGAGPARP